jgi:hypothetical protein
MLLLVVTSLEQFSVVFLASVDAYAQALSAEARSVPSCGTPPSPQQEGARECPACSCPPPPCTHDGPRGCDAPRVRGGAARGMPRLLGTMGQGPCAVRQGTASCGVRAEQPPDTIARRALAAGPRVTDSPRYNPPPQRYCKRIPPALKSLPVRVDTPVLPESLTEI